MALTPVNVIETKPPNSRTVLMETETPSSNSKTLLIVAMIISSLALVFSLWGVYFTSRGAVGQTGTTGTMGATGAAGSTGGSGAAGAVGATGTTGATGATGSFSTLNYHEVVVCVRSNGQFDGFRDVYGGPGSCPSSGDTQVMMLFRNQ